MLLDKEIEQRLQFGRRRVFAYAFRHTYAQLRADAEVPLDVLQALMGHEQPSPTQCYYRTSHGRRVDAVRDIAARFRFDINGDPVRAQTITESDAARQRLGVGAVPVPAGSCHEMNNVRADGHGCPVLYRCFSCRYFSTDFTHLPALRELRTAKAEQLARLQAGYGTVLRPGPLAEANLRLLTEEISQLGQLIRKCETDLASLTKDEHRRVQQWLDQRQRYATLIPVEALTARKLKLDQPTFDPAGLQRCQTTTVTATPASRHRAQILQAGRTAAAKIRRADSQRCRDRVTAVIDDMRRRRSPLSDAEITRRAHVNAQYLQRHRDKLHGEQVRAVLANDTARQANIAQSAAELALRTENAMLIEQNHQLRNDLDAGHAELRQLRVRELATAATGILGSRLPADEAVIELHRQLDELRAALHTAGSDLAAARNLNQRPLIENTKLLSP